MGISPLGFQAALESSRGPPARCRRQRPRDAIKRARTLASRTTARLSWDQLHDGIVVALHHHWVALPVAPARSSGPWRTARPNCKNPPKMRFKKFVKLTDHTQACNDLTNFEYVVHAMTGNGCYLNLQKLACKNSWNQFGWNYFRLVLAVAVPMVAGNLIQLVVEVGVQVKPAHLANGSSQSA